MKHFLPSRSLLVSIFLFFSLLFCATGFSQVARQWARIFDDRPNSWNQAKAVVTDNAGNAYVTGESAENNTGTLSPLNTILQELQNGRTAMMVFMA